MKLLIDPLLKAHLLDALDVAWPRTVAEAIERVQDGLVLAEFRDRQLAFELRVQRGGRGGLVAAGGGTLRCCLDVPGECRPTEAEAHGCKKR